MTEGKTFYSAWQQLCPGVEISRVISRDVSVEGIDINRYRSENGGNIKFESKDGHIVALLKGKATLYLSGNGESLVIEAPTHLYIPVAKEASKLDLTGACTILEAAAPAHQSRGTKLIVRNERYVQAVRFILTPQYLSRRIFVHRDETLVSKSNTPISWFRTTEFDTKGLPKNFEGESVVKMGYDYQTEPNTCYDVKGDVRVRYAMHPYVSDEAQQWTPWDKIDNETMYYLNEPSDGELVEWYVDKETRERKPLRNRHEVYVSPGGHVTLICIFDPAPTGLEKHTPGQYSSYTEVSKIIGTPEYDEYLKKVAPEDEMIDVLSMLEAKCSLEEAKKAKQWSLYEERLAGKIKSDEELYHELKSQGNERDKVIEQWMVKE